MFFLRVIVIFVILVIIITINIVIIIVIFVIIVTIIINIKIVIIIVISEKDTKCSFAVDCRGQQLQSFRDQLQSFLEYFTFSDNLLN